MVIPAGWAPDGNEYLAGQFDVETTAVEKINVAGIPL